MEMVMTGDLIDIREAEVLKIQERLDSCSCPPIGGSGRMTEQGASVS
jgi:hypothetical protein